MAAQTPIELQRTIKDSLQFLIIASLMTQPEIVEESEKLSAKMIDLLKTEQASSTATTLSLLHLLQQILQKTNQRMADATPFSSVIQ